MPRLTTFSSWNVLISNVKVSPCDTRSKCLSVEPMKLYQEETSGIVFSNCHWLEVPPLFRLIR
uniref:Uncharacterized protein n=1 Tax=Triticum urartu TaxID=4572 RepID=A0A8R7QNK6_TRIUA